MTHAPILTALGLLTGSAAVAQVPGTVGQPPQRPDRPDTRTPAARQAEDFSAQGVRLGSFKLFADLEADEVFTDNVYATSSAVGPVASFVQLVNPSVKLRSDWSNHMLNLSALGGFGFYGVDPSLNNYQDFSIGGDGRFDIQRFWNVYGGASWSRLHEVRGQPNTVTSPNVPITVYNVTSANVGYFQKINRVSARLDARFDGYSYFNNGLGPAQGVIPNSDRDRNEWREALRLGYEFITGYEVWVRGSLNQRRYLQLDSSGLDRSSAGFDIAGGMLIDVGSLTSIEFFVGYMQQNYVSGQFAPISTPTFGLTGYWNPLRELWVRPYANRVVLDSAFASSAAYISTAVGVDISYFPLPNLQVDGRFDYSIADYTAFSGTPGVPYEQYVTLRVSARYFLTNHFYLGPTYQFLHRTSNQQNADFNQNLIMVRLGARL